MSIYDMASTDAALRHLLEDALRAVGATEGSILLLTEDGKRLRFVVSHSPVADRLLGHEQDIGQGLTGLSVRSRRPVMANDVEHEKAFDPSVDMRTGGTTRSIMAVPLIISARCLGALTAVNAAAPGGFSQADLEHCARFGARIAEHLASLG